MNPTKLILSQITEQLEANNIKGIKEMYILIPADTVTAEIRLVNICDKVEKVDYDIDRKNILIKIFLAKFKKYCKSKDIDVESYTVKINLKEETISTFAKDNKGKLHSILI